MTFVSPEVDFLADDRDLAEDAPRQSSPRTRLARLRRGDPADPVWVRPALLALLLGTALLYVWGLGASGWGNSFYSAAVEAGSKSWKAMFFGSFDSSNFITVDKPPASLWVMDLSARVFGLNSWSVLVPQALEGVASVGLLYATVRRRFPASAALLAGLALALTPVATLMFRFNNPDALLTLLLIGSAYCVVRATETAGTRWLLLAGALVGFGFIAKMLQAIVIVPGFALVYLACAPTTVRRRIVQLLGAGAAMIVAAGWWVAIVTLTPASARPYVGGSTSNSILQLTFGYNGLGRLTGHERGSVGGGGGANGAGFWGATGITRMFNSEMGGQISWLIPAALVLAVALLWGSRRLPRVDTGRAQVLLWTSWLVVTGLTFSFGKGIIHPYYTVALAPAVAALVGFGGVTMFRRRHTWLGRGSLAVAVAVTALWSYRLLDRSPDWHPWLRGLVLVVGLLTAIGLMVPTERFGSLAAQAGLVLAAAGGFVGLAGPAAYSLSTAATPHTGAIPSAGPAVRGGFGPAGQGGPGRARFRGGFGGQGFSRGPGFGGQGGPQFGTPPFTPPGTGGGAPGGQLPGGSNGVPFGSPFGGRQNSPGASAPGSRGGGGLLDAGTPNAALTSALRAGASSYRWVAATVGAENASGYQLAAREPVLAIGGFNGTDPAPTLAQFEKLVAEGKIHYFIAGGRGGFGPGGGGGPGGSGTSPSSQITSWVGAHYTSKTIGGESVYDLTAASSGS